MYSKSAHITHFIFLWYFKHELVGREYFVIIISTSAQIIFMVLLTSTQDNPSKDGQ